MKIIEVLLLVVLVGVIIFDSVMQNGLREKIRRADMEAMRYQADCRRLQDELQTVLHRDEAKRSHQCLIRDQKIKELEAENIKTVKAYEEKLRVMEARYQTLEELANKVWPKNCGK